VENGNVEKNELAAGLLGGDPVITTAAQRKKKDTHRWSPAMPKEKGGILIRHTKKKNEVPLSEENTIIIRLGREDPT